MHIEKKTGVTLLMLALTVGFGLGGLLPQATAFGREANTTIFELRTYTANAGRLAEMIEELHVASRVFERHGMTNVGYWVPTDSPLSGNTLIYILKHKSRAAARQAWDDFRGDPEWRKAFAEFGKNGRLVANVDTVFMNATDYSPID